MKIPALPPHPSASPVPIPAWTSLRQHPALSTKCLAPLKVFVSQTSGGLKEAGANFILGNAFSFGRLDKGEPHASIRGYRSPGMNAFEQAVAKDLPTIVYMYWTGYVTPNGVHWPHEHTTYTAAAVILAWDVLTSTTFGSGIMTGHGIGVEFDEIALECDCPSRDEFATVTR